MWNRFRLQKYRNGGQMWAVNVFSYTIHAQTDSLPSCFPLALSIFFPLLLWRFRSSQIFCVHYTASQEMNSTEQSTFAQLSCWRISRITRSCNQITAVLQFIATTFMMLGDSHQCCGCKCWRYFCERQHATKHVTGDRPSVESGLREKGHEWTRSDILHSLPGSCMTNTLVNNCLQILIIIIVLTALRATWPSSEASVSFAFPLLHSSKSSLPKS
jgi:hypothetical protein